MGFPTTKQKKFQFGAPNKGESATALLLLPKNNLASAWTDGSLIFWHLTSGNYTVLAMKSKGEVRCLTLSPDHKWLACSMGKSIGLVNVNDLNQTRILKGQHAGVICSLAFSNDSRKLVSGGGDGNIKVWSLDLNQELFTLKGHVSPVTGVVFARDDKNIVSGSWDGKIIVWDWEKGKAIATFLREHEAITSFSLCPETGIVVFGTFAKTVRCFDLKKMYERPGISVEGAVQCLAFSKNGRKLVVGYGNCFAESGKGANSGTIHVLEFFP